MKVCSRCGKSLPIEMFRKYYNGGDSHYSYCKDCEAIEARRKYLVGRGDALTDTQRDELDKITKLYELRATKGLKVPGQTRGRITNRVSTLVDELLNEEAGGIS